MVTIKILLVLLSIAAAVATVLSLVRTREWWVRMFDFPRAQIAFGCVLLVVAIVFLSLVSEEPFRWWEILSLVLLVAAVVAQLRLILPYTRLWRTRVPSAPPGLPNDRKIRLLISNVRKGNRAFDRWLQVVRAEDPDVLVAVEPDQAWDEALRPLEQDYPHVVRQPQDNTYGLIVYSRRPLHRVRVKHLLEADVPSLFAVIELPSGQRVRFVLLHPRPPRPDIQQDSVLRDGELIRAGRIIRSFCLPVIVAGDLNDVAWSRSTRLFLRLSRLLDPRIGRGRFPTYHARHRLLRYPLDHVFHSSHFDLVELRRLPQVGSDHFPILIELVLRPEDDERPEALPMKEDDEDRAIDAVEDAHDLLGEESPEERRERQREDR